MKNLVLLLIITWFASCKKNETNNTTTTPVTNNNTVTQNAAFISSWRLDSVLLDGTIELNSYSGFNIGVTPTNDSIAFSSDHYKGYNWTNNSFYSHLSVLFDKWDTPYSDSVFIHNGGTSTSYHGYKYSINSNQLIMMNEFYDPAHHHKEYYYRKVN